MRLLQRLGIGIRHKIWVGFALIIGICVLFTLSIAYIEMSRVINRNIASYSQQVVDKKMENLEYYLEDINDLARNIILDETIVSLLGAMPESGEDPEPRRRLDTAVKRYQYLQSFITDISILDENRHLFLNFDYDYKNEPFGEEWYLDYVRFPSDRHYTGIHPSIIRGSSLKGADGFTYLVRIYDFADPTRYLGTLAIEIDAGIIARAVGNAGREENGDWSTIVLNRSNELMYNRLPQFDTSDWRQLLDEAEVSGQSRSSVAIDGVPMAAVFSQSDKFGWRMAAFMPRSELMNETDNVRSFIISIGLLCIIVALFLAFVISRGITDPLKALMRGIQEIEKGHFDGTLDIRSGDELERLGKLFNRMSLNIKQLIENNKLEERLKRKAELTALQAQINPHFLYNTLESINWLAVRKKEYAISDVLTNLGKFFRISLSKGASFIPLGQELEHIGYYIEIQKFRYTGRFDAHISCDEAAGSYVVPKLILQPLIENALLHGIHERESGGLLEVKAEVKERSLVITVTDNGAGMSVARLEEVQAKLAQRLRSSDNRIYGLSNIQERIKLAFGDQYGIGMSSGPGGTVVTVRLPTLTELPDDLV